MARRVTSSKRKTKPAEDAVVVAPPVKAAPVSFNDDGTEQLLTFLIGEDEYGISILRVREIAEYRTLTPVPMTPPWMRGVMNLRGTVVPVVDLAARLGLERTQVSRRTCLIIVELDADGERVVIAVMVDAVSRVVDISRSDVQEPPPFGLDIDFVPGLVRVDERLIVLLDLAAILSTAEVFGTAALLPSLRAAAESADARQ
jgi:purine-binding chemotaxis protein CheW